MSDELDPLRQMRPDRVQAGEPVDPGVLANERSRLMSTIQGTGEPWTEYKTPSIYPRLAYRDEYAALEFLTRAFGFRERRELRMEDDEWGMLAWLDFGDGVVMIGRAEHEIHGIYSPTETGNPTAMINVAVHDVDAHYRHAIEAGAEIAREIEDAFYGYRRYEAKDPEGHRWHFTEPLSEVEARRAAGGG